MDVLRWFAPVFFSLGFLIAWKSSFFPQTPLKKSKIPFLWHGLMALCVVAIFAVLRTAAAVDVKDDEDEVLFYLLFSLVALAVLQWLFAVLGISIRDDVAERKNWSASAAAAGFTIAATCCVAGANIGNGPGFEVVLFCSVLAGGTLLLLWLVFASLTGTAETITVGRDLSAGIRAGGWLAGSGVVLGASVAGDWHSLWETIRDFGRFAWPLLPCLVVFAMLERKIRRRIINKRSGIAPSTLLTAAFAILATAYAIWIGRQG